ncbi:hypothetical protein L1887_25756 [Cichorium endivia]|nr:hypothetical protein L1887_25756 [Cichorium endivia]
MGMSYGADGWRWLLADLKIESIIRPQKLRQNPSPAYNICSVWVTPDGRGGCSKSASWRNNLRIITATVAKNLG